VTLRFYASVDPDGLVDALNAAQPRLPSATATAGPQPALLGDRIWMVPIGGLETLADRVAAATSHLAPPEGPRPFSGHLTLARARHPADLRDLSTRPLGVEWTVREVVAFQSHLTSSGARHDPLGRWPLSSE